MKNKISVWAVIIVMLSLLFIFPVENVGSAWWNTDWDYYRTIEIESDYIDGGLTPAFVFCNILLSPVPAWSLCTNTCIGPLQTALPYFLIKGGALQIV